MIKKFNDFNKEDIKNNEINHYERELNARKKKREKLLINDDLSFHDIVYKIKDEIEEENNYYISTGKKEINNSQERIHIQFDSDNLGRINIFKPSDNSETGEYEVNGILYITNADEIRNFYHYLTQIIKR